MIKVIGIIVGLYITILHIIFTLLGLFYRSSFLSEDFIILNKKLIIIIFKKGKRHNDLKNIYIFNIINPINDKYDLHYCFYFMSYSNIILISPLIFVHVDY